MLKKRSKTLKLIFTILLASILSSSFCSLSIQPNYENDKEVMYVAASEKVEANEFINQSTSYVETQSKSSYSSNSLWNMVNYNMQTGVTSYENFNPSSYGKRQSTSQSSTFSLRNKNYSDYNDTQFETNIKEMKVNGVTYEYTESYIPEETNLSMTTFGYDGIYGEDDRTYVSNPKKWPYYATGKMLIRYDNVYNQIKQSYDSLYYIGTGFMEGPNILVTAGHCVYDDVTSGNDKYENNVYDPRFPDSIIFYPGLNGDGDTNSLSSNALVVNISKEYYQSTTFENDWAVVELDSNIGNITGYYGKISNWYEKNHEITTFGYPGDKGGQMWKSVATVTDLTNDGIYKLTNDLKGGQSGSGLHVSLPNGGYVCGIGTFYSYYVDDNKNYVTINTGGTQINTFMFHYMNSFVTNHNYDHVAATITPSDYGFADAYPTSETTKSHTLSTGFEFSTTRYRTGFIQGEYIVISPFRKDITKAYIEYNFNVSVTKIEVDLTHWRPLSNEWTYPSNCTAELRTESGYKLDLLSKEMNLPTDRTHPTTYTIVFDKPVYSFGFYMESNRINTNDSNRGRLCIGNMKVYTAESWY